MEIKTTPMTEADLEVLHKALNRSFKVIKTVGKYLFGIATVLLFMPLEILKFFGRRTARSNMSGVLIGDLGLVNTLLFVVMPISLLLVIYFLGARKIQMDIKQNLKEIGVVKILEIKPLDNETRKDLNGVADHVVKYEKNPFALDEDYFLRSQRPDLIQGRSYKIEVSKIAKVELKREIIEESL